MKRVFITLLVSVSLIGLCLIFPVKGFSQWVNANGPYGGYVNSVIASGNRLIAGTTVGIYVSDDNGESWTKSDNGLPDNPSIRLFSNDSFIYARINNGGGIFMSSDNGGNWKEVFTGLINKTVYDIVFFDEYIFVATKAGLFRSSDKGLSWKAINNGLTIVARSLGVSGSNLFAADLSGSVFRSKDNGENWNVLENGLPDNLVVRNFASYGQNIYIPTWYKGIFGSTDNGDTWTEMNTGLKSLIINSIAFIDEKMYASTNGDGVFVSTDNGMNWSQTGLPDFTGKFGFLNGKIFLCSSGMGVFVSNDGGTNWEQTTFNAEDTNISSFTDNDEYIYSSIMYGGVFRSKKDNIKWEPIFSYKFNNAISCLESSGDNIYTGTMDQGGIYRSSDKGETWDYGGYEGMVNMDMTAILRLGDKLFAGSRGGGIYVSEDNGDKWSLSGLIAKRIPFIKKINEVIYAGTHNSGIYTSTDEGKNWKPTNINIIGLSICSIGTSLFTGTKDGVYHSTNKGTNWTLVNSGLTNIDVLAIESYDTYLFAGTNGSGVFVSSDSGENWKSLGTELSSAKVTTLYISGSTLLAGTEGFGGWSFDLNKLTSVEDNLSADNLTVFPNPASDFITIQTSEVLETSEVSKLQIFDMLGIVVHTTQTGMSELLKIDVSHLPTGIYFIRTGKLSKKFVVYR